MISLIQTPLEIGFKDPKNLFVRIWLPINPKIKLIEALMKAINHGKKLNSLPFGEGGIVSKKKMKVAKVEKVLGVTEDSQKEDSMNKKRQRKRNYESAKKSRRKKEEEFSLVMAPQLNTTLSKLDESLKAPRKLSSKSIDNPPKKEVGREKSSGEVTVDWGAHNSVFSSKKPLHSKYENSGVYKKNELQDIFQEKPASSIATFKKSPPSFYSKMNRLTSKDWTKRNTSEFDFSLDDLSVTNSRSEGGFKNSGNTCYVNSVLQALSSIRPFAQEFQQNFKKEIFDYNS